MIEPTSLGLTPVQATEAVKAIRDFIITVDDSGDFKIANKTNEANQT